MNDLGWQISHLLYSHGLQSLGLHKHWTVRPEPERDISLESGHFQELSHQINRFNRPRAGQGHTYRRLYVDGVIVAEDVQDDLDISVNGLYFGTGKAMQLGTFFSGLIDDIRIYNRVVSP